MASWLASWLADGLAGRLAGWLPIQPTGQSACCPTIQLLCFLGVRYLNRPRDLNLGLWPPSPPVKHIPGGQLPPPSKKTKHFKPRFTPRFLNLGSTQIYPFLKKYVQANLGTLSCMDDVEVISFSIIFLICTASACKPLA